MNQIGTARWLVALVAAASVVAFAQERNSVQKEANDLQRQVELAFQQEDMPAVLKAMDRYHQLYQLILPPPDSDAMPMAIWKPLVPASLWLAEAKAAFAVKDAIRAEDALEALLKKGNADSPEYAEALPLRERYHEAAAKAKVARRKAAQASRPRLVQAIEQQMIDVPAGSFQMGDLSGITEQGHKPVSNTVSVKAFRLSRYEVTYEQFDQYVDATESERPRAIIDGRGRQPVVFVSWLQAQGFVAWLNQSTGRKFRLPTEAEWEYAARAGSRSDYPWGETFDTHLANGDGTGPGDSWYFAAPVGSFPPNAWGLYDMIGNVQEWTQDCNEGRDANAPADGSARHGPPDCRHVYRGGSWAWPSYYLFSSSRFEANTSGTGDSDVGFRLAEDR